MRIKPGKHAWAVSCGLGIGVAVSISGCGGARLSIEPPVYNVGISPQLQPPGASAGPRLRAGAVTTLRFGIGPQWPSSVAPAIEPNPAIVQSPVDLPLTAVLACSFCEAHAAFVRDLLYRRSDRESDIVSFEFTPRPPTTAEGDGFDGRLELSVFDDRTGQEYDRFVIPVSIAREGTLLETPATAAVGRRYEERDPEPSAADVELRVVEDAGRQLQIEILPFHPSLKQSLQALVTGEHDRPRRFRTAILNQEDLQKITTGAYGTASAISLQGELAARLNRGGPRPIVSGEARKTLALSAPEATNVAAIIAQTGRILYQKLFVDGPDGATLSQAIGLLEAADADLGRPVRLHIRSDHLVAPWQYIHPMGGTVDPAKFWGMRFDLSVQRIGNGAPARLGPVADAGVRTVIFARHGSTSDQTVPLATMQIEQLKRLPVPGLAVVASREQLLGLLRGPSENRARVSAIITFLHAVSGRGLVTNDDPEGPLILFGDQDAVSARVLQGLPSEQQTAAERLREPRYLGGAPLFILNACETGPSTVALPHSTFEEVAFELGAQGVVVTEVSVWVSLGHEVGTRLLRKLGEGQPVASALAAIRRELVTEKRNPLGLLYAYYGDPGATLRR